VAALADGVAFTPMKAAMGSDGFKEALRLREGLAEGVRGEGGRRRRDVLGLEERRCRFLDGEVLDGEVLRFGAMLLY
jgi:hypothetical protein